MIKGGPHLVDERIYGLKREGHNRPKAQQYCYLELRIGSTRHAERWYSSSERFDRWHSALDVRTLDEERASASVKPIYELEIAIEQPAGVVAPHIALRKLVHFIGHFLRSSSFNSVP